MIITNKDNYPTQYVFSNIDEPLKTPKGDTAYLVADYAGLYGVAVGNGDRALLVFVTDSWDFAKRQHRAHGLGGN